ncbi:hypothetical protein QE152_g30849 [Popillia japonica]|uniref:Uncharacterized protein n=1 Tax=Popillia japonica TaxID=7064 RepID=A0AAW1JDA2_POPJA
MQSKFQSLKQNATKELKKCIFKKSGSGGEETAEPSLWYYNSISYVFDNNLPRESTDSLDKDTFDEQIDAEEFEVQDETTDNELLFSGLVSPEGAIIEDLDQRSVSRGSSAVERAPVSKKKRQKKNEDIVLGKVSETLDTISRKLNTPSSSNENNNNRKTANESFCDYVLSKLNRIDEH